MTSNPSTGIQLRQTASVQDDTFAIGQLPNYLLLLSLSKSSVQLSVIDLARNKVVALEAYDPGRLTGPGQAAAQLDQLIEQHKWLNAGQWGQIRCAVQHSPYTLIPASLFEEAEKEAYYKLVAQPNPQQEQLMHYAHTGLDMVVLFGIESQLVDQVGRLSSRARITYVHGASAFIEGVLHTQLRSPGARAYILVEQQQATMLLLRDGAMVFCNSFYFTTPEDFIYYVLLVLQEHQVNPETDPVVVWGELTPDSALFGILQKYIRHAALGKRPTSLSYSYRLQDLFPHRYFDLYSLALCNG